MDSGTLIILVWLVITLLFAWLDGALGLLMLGLVAALLVYFTFVGFARRPGLFTATLHEIYQRKEREIRNEVQQAPPNSDERKRLEHKAKKKIEALIKIRAFDETWIRRAAALFFLATLACPWFGAGTVLYLLSTSDRVEGWFTSNLQAYHERKTEIGAKVTQAVTDVLKPQDTEHMDTSNEEQT